MSNVSAYCKVAISPVRAETKDTSEMVTQLLFGEVIEIIEKEEKWFKIRTFHDNYVGWVDPKQIRSLSNKEVSRWLDGLSFQRDFLIELKTPWGPQHIYKGSFLPFNVKESFTIGNDEFIISKTLVSHPNSLIPIDFAKEYLNAPYLWGGKTTFGIDCSGLIQMVFRFLDINLPRDASQQVDYGSKIDFSDRLSGDVCFFKNESNRIIHVGILVDENQIIHASGQVRIDNYDENGILHYSGNSYTHHFASLKRML